MNEEEIKKLRHSFTNPYKEDSPKIKKNQFGHTILGDSNDQLDTSEIEVKFDEFGQVRADLSKSLIDTEHMAKWAQNRLKFDDQDLKTETHAEENINPVKNDIYSSLMLELDEMDGTVSKPKNIENLVKTKTKNCANKDCLYELPKDANFCLKCGTAQLARFCVECGFNFKSEEKFCPDCGTKR